MLYERKKKEFTSVDMEVIVAIGKAECWGFLVAPDLVDELKIGLLVAFGFKGESALRGALVTFCFGGACKPLKTSAIGGPIADIILVSCLLGLTFGNKGLQKTQWMSQSEIQILYNGHNKYHNSRKIDT